jgi:ketosteroid isomerase-like protein
MPDNLQPKANNHLSKNGTPQPKSSSQTRFSVIRSPLTYEEMHNALLAWLHAWNAHDLAGVMALLADDVVFENWAGKRIVGKAKLERIWAVWFARDETFCFDWLDVMVDTAVQKALIHWRLHWSPPGQPQLWEIREGVDVLHFANGRITAKLTFTKEI